MKLKNSFGIISEDQLLELEDSLGKVLPKEYKDFLLRSNGGRPNPNTFKTKNDEHETDIQFFFGITEGTYNILDKHLLLESRLGPGRLAIANDSLGSHITIDLKSGEIYFFDHETEEFHLVSETIDKFINSLYALDEDIKEVYEATVSEDINFFKSLIDSGQNVNEIKNEYNQNVFIAACLRGKLKLIKFFVENGVKIEGGLISSCGNGHLNTAKYLLEIGANVNERETECNNYTPLIKACMKGYLDIAKLLIEKGADIHAVDDYDYNALKRSKNQDLIDYLEKEVYK